MDTVVERVHEAARLTLVREPDGRTRWTVPHYPLETSDSPTTSVHLHPKTTTMPCRGGRLDLDASCFQDKRSCFRLVQPKDGAPATQNLLLFLHGCGDSHDPFARLGEQMALPQTAVVSLRAPLELPFDLGFAWVDDFDETGSVIPPDIPHERRSQSLQAARN
uniref:Phospholipase/carboxylesterase/thioesterase domain-containing protein n=1 Tax=Peronospora matthiolae TaxID=2874970 RepID=A0AAV1TE52_9STRA